MIQLTIVSDSYLNPTVTQRLRAAHRGIVQILPEIQDLDMFKNAKNIDLSKNIDELFLDYFIREKNQEPNEDLKHLFKEILAVELD